MTTEKTNATPVEDGPDCRAPGADAGGADRARDLDGDVMSKLDYPADAEIDDGCPNCGGEGYVACCIEEYACIDPEGGCDLCMRRCDWCNSKPARAPKTEGE